jgi:hypothetical protein
MTVVVSDSMATARPRAARCAPVARAGSRLRTARHIAAATPARSCAQRAVRCRSAGKAGAKATAPVDTGKPGSLPRKAPDPSAARTAETAPTGPETATQSAKLSPESPDEPAPGEDKSGRDEQSSTAGNDLAVWFVQQTAKPSFIAMEAALALAFLALLDGGLSGVQTTTCRLCSSLAPSSSQALLHTGIDNELASWQMAG